MNFIRLRAVARKEVRHILRDPRSLISAILLPLCLMFAYCESLSLDVNNIPMSVLDYSKTEQSRDLVNKFTSSGYFYVENYVDNYKAMQQSINKGDSVIGLSIPYDFAQKLQTENATANVQVILDGADPNRGSIASSYASMIVQRFAAQIRQKNKSTLRNTFDSIEAQIRIWFNPSLRSKNDIVPGLTALIMAIFAALLTSTTISKEWESGTMELLVSTPIKPGEILLGKFLPYFVIGGIDIIGLVALGYFVYDVPIKGSLLLLSIIIVLFLSGVLFFGMAISVIVKSSLASNLIALMLMFLPTMLLSGFIFFIPAMPKILQGLSFLVPAKYFITASKGIYAKAVSFEILLPEIIILLLFNLIVFAAAHKKFRKTLD